MFNCGLLKLTVFLSMKSEFSLYFINIINILKLIHENYPFFFLQGMKRTKTKVVHKPSQNLSRELVKIGKRGTTSLGQLKDEKWIGKHSFLKVIFWSQHKNATSLCLNQKLRYK